MNLNLALYQRILLPSIFLGLVTSMGQAKISGKERDEILERHLSCTESIAKARAYYEAGKYSEAVDLIEQWRRSDSLHQEAEQLRLRSLAAQALINRIQELLSSGKVAYSKDDFETALVYYKDVLDMEPDHAEAQKYMEMCQLALRVKKGSPAPGDSPELKQRLHSYTLVLRSLEKEQVPEVLVRLQTLESIQGVQHLGILDGIAFFRISATAFLTPDELTKALEQGGDPELKIESPSSDFVLGHVVNPKWMSRD